MEEKMEARYWLRLSGLPWQKATRKQYVQAERTAGFRPKLGCGDVATASFQSGAVEGRTTYGEITEKDYGWDPEFLKAALRAAKIS